MKRKEQKRIGLISLFITVLILTSCFHSSAATRDWYVGVSVKYGYALTEDYRSETIIDGLSGYEYGSMEMEIKIKILSVDLNEHEYEANLTMAGGYNDDYSGATDPEFFGYVLTDSFDVDYDWDDNSNRLVLTDFDFYGFYLTFFLEPEWDLFNSQLDPLFDRDRLIDVVTTDLTTYELYWGDFLDSIASYNIIGVTNLVDSGHSVSNTTHKWTLSFDLSNAIYYHDYDYETSTHSYHMYDVYKASYTLEYTDGGTLEKMELVQEYKVTTNERAIQTEEKMIIKRGGIEAVSSPIDFGSSILAILILPVLVYLLKPRRKKIKGVISNE